jgi:hypothetical protein
MLTLRLRALPCALAAALLATPSHALMLGEPQVRSYLGRPLDVRIPVQGAGADAVDASCFEVLADPQGGVATLSRAQLEVEQQEGQTYLRVRSSEPMREPASILRLRAACAPSKGMLVRQYGILLDPLPASTPSAPLVVHTAEDAGVAPRDAMQVAGVTSAPSSSVAASTPASAASAPAPVKPRVHARKNHGIAHAKPRHHAPVAIAHGGFHLKLSGPVLDLEPTRHVTDAERERLREARTLMDGDDYASAMLALRDRIGTLQKRLEMLQAQAARIEAVQRERPQVAAVPQREPNVAARLADGAWSWAIVALLGLLALLMPLTRWMRRRRPAEVPELVVKKPRAPETGTETGRFAPPPPEVIAPATAATAPASPAPLAFDDTEEAIRTARDLYNSGERLQAAGVLRLAIERHPERVAPWLPLFDLLMRERLATEYAELARGFQVLHGASPAWKTVQRAGQQIDPANPLYADGAAPHQVAA